MNIFFDLIATILEDFILSMSLTVLFEIPNKVKKASLLTMIFCLETIVLIIFM